MSVEIDPKYAERLNNAYYVWLTTVRDDGQPQPTPVWLLWRDGNCLILSQPDTYKVKNIAANPRVALSFSVTDDGENYVVVTGEAWFDPNPVPKEELDTYMAKYAEGLKALGMTPEGMARDYSVVIRINITRVRGQ